MQQTPQTQQWSPAFRLTTTVASAASAASLSFWAPIPALSPKCCDSVLDSRDLGVLEEACPRALYTAALPDSPWVLPTQNCPESEPHSAAPSSAPDSRACRR